MLRDLQERDGLAYLFISHDIAVVGELCQNVLVLEHGSVVDQGPVATVLSTPSHPYTKSLLRDSLAMPGWAR
jgi:ABC-type microcin C transport system duplicated ATPase subunit YejF